MVFNKNCIFSRFSWWPYLKKIHNLKFWQKIFVPILPFRSTLLDLDCEIVTVLNAEIFPSLWGMTGHLKWGSMKIFSMGSWYDTQKRALCIILTCYLYLHFLVSQKSIFERKWMNLKENEWKMTLFMVDPQRYCFIRNYFLRYFPINVFLSTSHAMIDLKELYSQYEQMSISLCLGWEQD